MKALVSSSIASAERVLRFQFSLRDSYVRPHYGCAQGSEGQELIFPHLMAPPQPTYWLLRWSWVTPATSLQPFPTLECCAAAGSGRIKTIVVRGVLTRIRAPGKPYSGRIFAGL